MDSQEISYFVHKKDLYRNDFRKLSNWAFFFLISLIMIITGKSTQNTFVYIVYFPVLLVFVTCRYFFEDSYKVIINKHGFLKIRESGKIDSLYLNDLARNTFEYVHGHLILFKNKKHLPDEKFKLFIPQTETDKLLAYIKHKNLVPNLDEPNFLELIGYAIRPWTIFDYISKRITYFSILFKMQSQTDTTTKR